jgi:DNA-directed RNA polymerase II subunit RPB1
VYHAGLIEFIRKTLRCVCFNCSKLLLPKDKEAECKRIKHNANRFGRVLKICDTVKECKTDVGGCGRKQPKFTKSGLRIQIEHNDEIAD